MKLRVLALLAALALAVTGLGGASSMTMSASAASTLDFHFDNGQMSEEVLNNYLSRAVTYMGLCAEGGKTTNNMAIDEDIRFLLRTGTKFVSRAALFAWSCTSASMVEQHYKNAEINAKKVHDADPEIILQGFVAEIVRKWYVKDIPVPAWVFEAFGEEPEARNFVFEDIINEELGPNYWSTNAGYPDWSRPETQRWYYYCIVRYIDAGYESIHIQEGASEGNVYDPDDLAACDKVLTMSRDYAKKHARRGVVLFHTFFAMAGGGCKVGNRLVFDINGNGLVPNETEYNEETGAYECKISYPDGTYWCTWFGRSAGGEHPLGFTVETCPTILEFDNYGQISELNVSNGPAFGTWGYDDITWFATQPEEYRNEFLKYLAEYAASNRLSSEGKQQYYILFPGRRCITPDPNFPVTKYYIGDDFNVDFLLDYASQDNYTIDFAEDIRGSYYTLTHKGYYKANRVSDGCPNGYNQEDTIREIFLGKNAKEDPRWDTVVLPEKYTKTDSTTKKTTKKTTASTTAATKPVTDGTDAVASAPEDTTATTLNGEVSTEESTVVENSTDVAEPDVSTDTAESAVDVSEPADNTDGKPEKTMPVWPFIVGGVALVAAAAVGVVALIRKKRGTDKD